MSQAARNPIIKKGRNGSRVIAYRIRDSLYLNLTNRCTAVCIFCHRFEDPYVKGHNLRLTHEQEPSTLELLEAIGDPCRFKEIIFCGYGEPTLRLEVIKAVAKRIKEKGGRVRLNTNGHGNLIHKRNICSELKGLIDAVSVSLNAESAEKYYEICHPIFGPDTYTRIKEFVKEARRHIPQVEITAVHLLGVNLKKCEWIAREELGIKFRVRELDVLG